MLGVINNASMHNENQGEKRARKIIVSNFSFVIGDEKYSHKYMYFDHKNFDSEGFSSFIYKNFKQMAKCAMIS